MPFRRVAVIVAALAVVSIPVAASAASNPSPAPHVAAPVTSQVLPETSAVSCSYTPLLNDVLDPTGQYHIYLYNAQPVVKGYWDHAYTNWCYVQSDYPGWDYIYQANTLGCLNWDNSTGYVRILNPCTNVEADMWYSLNSFSGRGSFPPFGDFLENNFNLECMEVSANGTDATTRTCASNFPSEIWSYALSE